MKIKKTIETPEGDYTFEGELSEEEHSFILEAGINYLVKAGIMPFKIQNKKSDVASYIKPEEPTVQ